MKNLLNIQNSIRFIIYLILSILLSSCDKDSFPPDKKYFDCKINGITYKAATILFPSIYEARPISGYFKGENLHYFHFYTDCYSQNSSADPFSLSYNLYLDAPLEIGKKYFVESIPDLDYKMPFQTQKEYHEKRQSYCELSYEYVFDSYCFGKGFVEFYRIDFDKNRVEGKLEFEIPFPDAELGTRTTLKIIGDFRSNLRSS